MEKTKTNKEEIEKELENRGISGLVMSGYLKSQREKEKKKGSYVNRFFKDDFKPIKETFYIGDEKFSTIKLVREENG